MLEELTQKVNALLNINLEHYSEVERCYFINITYKHYFDLHVYNKHLLYITSAREICKDFKYSKDYLPQESFMLLVDRFLIEIICSKIYTIDQMYKYIQEKKEKIYNCIIDYIKFFEEENDITGLLNPENDWIRESLDSLDEF